MTLMPEWLRKAFSEERQLRWKRQDIERNYADQLGRIDRNENPAAHDALIWKRNAELAVIDERLAGLETQDLIEEARELSVATPDPPPAPDQPNTGDWLIGPQTGTPYLNHAALAALSQAIEEAQQRRLEAQIAELEARRLHGEAQARRGRQFEKTMDSATKLVETVGNLVVVFGPTKKAKARPGKSPIPSRPSRKAGKPSPRTVSRKVGRTASRSRGGRGR